MKSTVKEADSGVFNLKPSVAFQIGGSGWQEDAKDIAIDSNGNVWVTGDFFESIDIDGDGINDLTSNGYEDSYVAKFSSNGDLVKAYDFGSSVWGVGDNGFGIATDSNDNAWVLGRFHGSIDIDGDGINDLTSSRRINDLTSFNTEHYLAKFDEEGDFVKALKIGGKHIYHSDRGNNIATDSNGNVWTKGHVYRSTDIDGDGINDLTPYTAGKNDSYFAKFSSEGDLVKAFQYGGSSEDYGHGIAIDSNGNVWATGSFSGSIDIDGDGINDLTSNGKKDSYFAKFDSEGGLLFAKNIGGSDVDSGVDIATDSNGNAWVKGYFQGNIDIDGNGINDLTNGSYDGIIIPIDTYVAKFDSKGNLVKVLDIGPKGSAIATDSNDNLWVTGAFKDSIDIDGDGKNDLTSNGKNDSYVAKFDEEGNLVKALNIGGTNSDGGDAIATDSNGNVWATGKFSGSIDIDGDGNNDLTSNGNHDIYVIKFSEATNAAPTDINLSNNSIDENVADFVIGTFSTTDPDTGDTFTYQLVAGTGDTDNAAFTIVGDQLQINSSPDFETQSSYSIRVQTTDAGGESYSENFTINVNEDTTAPDTPDANITVTSAPEDVLQLKLTPSEPTKAVVPNTSVSFDVNYSTEPAETPTTGIVFHMHWDSSQVAFDPVTGLTSHFSFGAQPTSAVLDDPVTNGGLDGDPNTDKYILQAWIDAEGNWPNNSNPTLYTANFTALPGFNETRINFSANPDHLPANSNFVPSSIALTSRTLPPTLDIDGNGVIDALTDGILAIRYLFELRGETLTKDALGEGATRDTEEIVAYLDEVGDTMLDVDGNGTAGGLTDGILFLRYALGFKDRALIEGAVSEDATRTTEPAILEHMQSFDLL
ncbi:MAG: hypothetical protein EBE86_001675 [Hormoscilla sp. GUM202]|nr:hypothetical protein [Hormoscilla sp. GUM202]